MTAPDTISLRMLQCLQTAKEQLSDAARDRIAGYVRSQQTDEGSFVDRNGSADLYYTLFGCMLAFVLDIPLRLPSLTAYLHRFDVERLDFVHYAACLRCRLMTDPAFTPTVRAPETFPLLPHHDRQSPYTRFLWLSLLEDTGGVPEREQFLPAAEPSYDSVTNLAAALLVRGQLDGYLPPPLTEQLRRRQHEWGGFPASPGLFPADLLSTATALFALHSCQVAPLYDPYPFITAHWQENGGFTATLDSEACDVEYTFYGLLALGTIKN
ncbi:MAG: hypothetical protein LBN06_03915 [Prevotellaceae bacterium]|jgi:hypothetical protein|nr:hypothetical protein [Prevotellaceae bacterium]